MAIPTEAIIIVFASNTLMSARVYWPQNLHLIPLAGKKYNMYLFDTIANQPMTSDNRMY